MKREIDNLRNFFNELLLRKNDFLLVLASVFTIGFFAHGYRFFNHIVSHDSVVALYWNGKRLISLGRFCTAVYARFFRGCLITPLVNGVFSLIFLSLAAFFTANMFSIKKKVGILLVSGVFVSNYVYTLIAATYLHDLDTYCLSLLFAVLSAYVIGRNSRRFFSCALLLVFSLGFYAAFFQVSVALLMIFSVKNLLEKGEAKKVFFDSLRYVLGLLLGLLMYYFVWKLVLFLLSMRTVDTYNGLSGIGHFGSLSNVVSLIFNTYIFMAKKILHPPLIWHWKIVGILSSFMVLFVVLESFYTLKVMNCKKSSFIFLTVIFALMPFGANCVYFIAKGMEHDLMIFSFSLIYVFALMICELKERNNARPQKITTFIALALGMIVFTNAINSNQVYLKKELEAQATLSLATRIIDRLETLDRYEVGKTPVVFIRNFSKFGSSISLKRKGFSYEPTGLEGNFAITYQGTELSYFFGVLGYPLNMYTNPEELKNLPEVQKMPSFPSKGCVLMINGIAIVKLPV